jgi:hypothetical protein
MSTRDRIGRIPRRIVVLLLAAAAVTAIGGMAASALTTPPPRSTLPALERDVVSVGLGRSVPVRIVIPSLGVDAEIVSLKLDRGGLGLPADAGHAGWYERGTSPGELGSAVIVGRAGPAGSDGPIFAGLDRLATGDTVQVVRADGAIASFAVDRVDTSGNQKAVHDTGGEVQLRLVSADGTDPPLDHQVVVFATLRA